VRGVTATGHDHISSFNYPVILNRPGSKEDIMESFAKKFGTDFVTLVFSNMRVVRYGF
jgi:hypothetical protein